MLIGNSMRLASNPMRLFGGITALNDSLRGGPLAGASRNQNNAYGRYAAKPNGHLHPSAWFLPQKAGGMSVYMNIAGLGSLANGNLAGGLNGGASLAGIGSITDAGLVPIIQAVAALAGSGALTGDITGKLEAVAALSGNGSITSANLASLLDAMATLAGSGTLSANILGKLDAAATLAGVGSITDASANMIVLASAVLSGSGTLAADIIGAWYMAVALNGAGSLAAGVSAPAHVAAILAGNGTLVAQPYASGDMSALISIASAGEELTADAVANAVWAYNVDTGVTAQQAIQLLLAAGGSLTPEQATRLEELWQMAGLDPTKPVTATKTRRYLGDSVTPDIDQTITGNGRTTSTITRT